VCSKGADVCTSALQKPAILWPDWQGIASFGSAKYCPKSIKGAKKGVEGY